MARGQRRQLRQRGDVKPEPATSSECFDSCGSGDTQRPSTQADLRCSQAQLSPNDQEADQQESEEPLGLESRSMRPTARFRRTKSLESYARRNRVSLAFHRGSLVPTNRRGSVVRLSECLDLAKFNTRLTKIR